MSHYRTPGAACSRRWEVRAHNPTLGVRVRPKRTWCYMSDTEEERGQGGGVARRPTCARRSTRGGAHHGGLRAVNKPPPCVVMPASPSRPRRAAQRVLVASRGGEYHGALRHLSQATPSLRMPDRPKAHAGRRVRVAPFGAARTTAPCAPSTPHGRLSLPRPNHDRPLQTNAHPSPYRAAGATVLCADPPSASPTLASHTEPHADRRVRVALSGAARTTALCAPPSHRERDAHTTAAPPHAPRLP